MTATPSTPNPSDGARDLDTDPHHDALASTDAEPDAPEPIDASLDTRSAAEIAEERDELSVEGPAGDAPGPAIPAIPKWVVPAVSAVLVFLLLAFPIGWTIGGALIGASVAALISYAFVFKL